MLPLDKSIQLKWLPCNFEVYKILRLKNPQKYPFKLNFDIFNKICHNNFVCTIS